MDTLEKNAANIHSVPLEASDTDMEESGDEDNDEKEVEEIEEEVFDAYQRQMKKIFEMHGSWGCSIDVDMGVFVTRWEDWNSHTYLNIRNQACSVI